MVAAVWTGTIYRCSFQRQTPCFMLLACRLGWLVFLVVCIFTVSSCAENSFEGVDRKRGRVLTADPDMSRRVLRCRACRALATTLADEVLYPEQEKQGERTGAQETNTVKSGRRQRLVVAVHEAIDSLCQRVKKQKNIGEITDSGSEDNHSVDTARSPETSVDSHADSEYEQGILAGIESVCDEVLEEVSDDLADRSFALLMPERVKHLGKLVDKRGLLDVCETQQHCTAEVYNVMRHESKMARLLLQKKSSKGETNSQSKVPLAHSVMAAVPAHTILRVVGMLLFFIALLGWHLRGRCASAPVPTKTKSC
ncbi:hypothetical protein TRVL_01480 [Trypanosoma vivax]|nr:hypothetical protein TRVL_01480 [Trypanosoma vivax]